jgi:uncharacterized protein YcbK (DUF882 family)
LKKIIVDSKDIDDEYDDSRRNFLKTGAIITSGIALSSSELFGRTHRRKKREALTLHNIHLNRTFHAEFFDGYRYNITGLFQIDKALMDYRAWQIARIDLKLVNLLYEINRFVGLHHKINIISGYRSPQTNSYLRKHSRGVAKRSYHMKAQAADIQIPGIRLSKLRSIARSIGMGGVGYYPRSNFIHVDVGPVRSWRRG